MTQARQARTRNGGGRERGSVIVEAAILLPLLALLIMSVVELGRFYYTKISLENATREAGRFAVTGNLKPEPGDPAQAMNRDAGIKAFLIDYLEGYAASIKEDKLTITLNPGDGGGPGAIVTITTECPFEFATPLIGTFFDANTYVVSYTSVMKNEPVFSPIVRP